MPDTREGGRRYTWRGQTYPSVTTILGAIAKPALVYWAAKSVSEYVADNIDFVHDQVLRDRDDAIQIMKASPYKSRDRAASLGSSLHAVAEAHSRGEALPPTPPAVAPYVRSFLEFIKDMQPEPLLTEEKVFHTGLTYGGTFDSIARIGGKNIILDYKTGKGVYPETALQLVAYARGEFYDAGNAEKGAMPQIDGAAIIHIREKGYAYVTADIGDETWNYFRACRKLYEFTKVGGRLLGD